MKGLVFFLIAVMFGLVAYAPKSHADNVTGEVQRIYVDNGLIHFRIKGDTCNPGKYYFIPIAPNPVEARMLYDLLLAAAHSSTSVTLQTKGNAGCPSPNESASIPHKPINWIIQNF